MSRSRCPSCGGLVGAGADWCGQCLSPLTESAEPAPEALEPRGPADAGPAPEGELEQAAATPTEPLRPEDRRPRARSGPVEVAGDRMVWTCPTCGAENGIEASMCPRCETPFSYLFREPDPAPTVGRERAFGLSLLFPGVGHMAVGQVSEGIARAVIFAWVAGSGIAIFVARSERRAAAFALLATLYVLAALGLWAVTALDAARAAGSDPPLVTSRNLFYGAAGLMMLTVVVLLMSSLRLGS